MIQVRDGRIAAVEAFGGSGFDRPIARDALPGEVGGMTRDDLAGFGSVWEPLRAEAE